MTAAQGVPERQRMPCRMVEQHSHVMFRRSQIADPKRDRACDCLFSASLGDISVSGARILAPQPGPLGSRVTVTLQHVGDATARIVDGSDTMFVVEFAAADETRDALIRKIFSGRYGQRPIAVHWGGLLGALLARVLR